jgi:AraC-like DNA-binding protein
MRTIAATKLPEPPPRNVWRHRHSEDAPKAIHPVSSGAAPTFWMLPETKTRAFTARTHHEPTYRYLWHYHPEWEIVFSRSGRGTRHVGNSVEKFGPGDLTMLPGKIPHTWFSSKNQVGPSCCTVIHFLPEVWGESFWNLPELRSFHALCQGAMRGVRFTGEGVMEVGERMEALAQKDTASLGSLLELCEIFHLLTKLEMHSLKALKEGSRGRESSRLDDLLAWLESNSGDPLTQQEAAARVRMSPAVFSRWFKMNMGCVFNRYLNEIRVAKVCSGIAHRNMSITEAAYHAGYNNLSNFNRRFREVTGLTPRVFRAQLEQSR